MQVERGASHRQLLLDIIIDALWILKRNKLLTSGLVLGIALQILMTTKVCTSTTSPPLLLLGIKACCTQTFSNLNIMETLWLKLFSAMCRTVGCVQSTPCIGKTWAG